LVLAKIQQALRRVIAEIHLEYPVLLAGIRQEERPCVRFGGELGTGLTHIVLPPCDRMVAHWNEAGFLAFAHTDEDCPTVCVEIVELQRDDLHTVAFRVKYSISKAGRSHRAMDIVDIGLLQDLLNLLSGQHMAGQTMRKMGSSEAVPYLNPMP
jgi:hypothetical protein